MNSETDPTPEQIREACRRIREGWTAAEEERRRCYRQPRVTLKTYQVEIESLMLEPQDPWEQTIDDAKRTT